jgi:Fe-S cluster assembly ATP-binding protein
VVISKSPPDFFKDKTMLTIADLQVRVGDEAILHGVTLSIMPGTVHAIMGPNGSGKSSLAYTILGHPKYQVVGGSLSFYDTHLVGMSPDARARLGIFLSFQHPLEIPGVSVMTFLKEAHHALTGQLVPMPEFRLCVQQVMERLQVDPAMMYRNLNDGFSGGERKQFEMVQLMLFKPKLAILDEIDSGLDIDALKRIAHGLHEVRRDNPTMSILLITHYQRILQYINPDEVHILCQGTIVQSGDYTLAHALEQRGYDVYRQKDATSANL